MPSLNDETPPLLIRCPACGQRFKVGADLRERTVECGGCEHRFRINDDVILRSRKFYPGERPEIMANRYQRVPIVVAVPEGLQTINYADHPDPAEFEPVAPQRIIAGVAAGVGVFLMALLLFFGAVRGGPLDGMSTVNRMSMAGFAAVLGTVLLLYANPRSRGKALLFALLSAALLLGLPLICTEGSVPLKVVAEDAAAPVVRPPAPSPEQERISQLRQMIGTDPLTGEIARLATEGRGQCAYGLWLRGLSEGNKLLVRDYLLRVAAADPSSHPYPRDRNDYLMVVTGVDMTIEKLAELAAPLGEVAQILREIDVIEIRVNNGNFVPGPIEKLTNKAGAEFYQLNKRELESIDLERVQAAVKRLADAEPKLYRNDIARRLIALLKEDGVEFKDVLCGALMRWADESQKAGDAAEAVLKKLVVLKKPIPRELIGLLVQEKRVSIIPILNDLWLADPGTWEQYYVELGPPIEATLIRGFPEVSGGIRHSVVRMLAKVGGADSLPLLTAARTGADPELLVRIESAEKSIRERLGQ
jgi:hypothetical protein